MAVVDINKANLAFGFDQFTFDESIDLDLFDIDGNDNNDDSRYMRPKIDPFVKANIRYNKAKDLAEHLSIGSNERVNVVLSGNFVFGDFIEQWIVKEDTQVEQMYVSTLSMSEGNVNSLKALIKNEWVEELHLFLSDYFYSHERLKMMPVIMNELDIDDKFQLAISGMHVKVTLLKMCDGRHIVMHGSANLRSSACLEQLCIEESKELFDFYVELFAYIEQKFKIINKSVRRNQCWTGMEKHIKREGA